MIHFLLVSLSFMEEKFYVWMNCSFESGTKRQSESSRGGKTLLPPSDLSRTSVVVSVIVRCPAVGITMNSKK